MKIVAVVVIVASGLYWLISNQSIVTSEIHLLPSGFKGVVMIIHDQVEGQDIVKEKGSIIYDIPPDGILITKAPLAAGLKNIKYYYFENGSKTELKYCWDYNTLSDSSVNVFGGSTGTYGQDGQEVDCTTYLVCSKSEVDSLSNVLNKMLPIEILRGQ